MKTRSNILIVVVILLLAGCTSDITNVEKKELPTLTDKQIELRTNMKQAALLITDLVKDPSVVKELKFAADYSREELGRDEDVYFSELFGSNAPYKQALGKAKQNASDNFATAFRNAVQSTRAKGASGENLETYLQANNLKLYWPYSENWSDDVLPTISYDPLDNEDENEGFKPIGTTQKNKAAAGFETITMNDEYGYNNPSMLIVPCEEEQIQQFKGAENILSGCGGGGTGGGSGGSGGDGGSGDIAKKILIKDARLTKQMDGFFAGGSEIYWHSANAVLVTPNDTQPILKPIKIKFSFSRKDIRKKRWKGLNSLFDQNWSEYELARQLLIIEGDGNPRIKKFGIKVGIPKVGEIGFDIENFEVNENMDSRRTTLFNNFLERDIFFVDNNINDGNGFRNGVKIRHVDHLSWTMTVTNINF